MFRKREGDRQERKHIWPIVSRGKNIEMPVVYCCHFCRFKFSLLRRCGNYYSFKQLKDKLIDVAICSVTKYPSRVVKTTEHF